MHGDRPQRLLELRTENPRTGQGSEKSYIQVVSHVAREEAG